MSNNKIKNIISEKINKEDIRNNIVNKRSIDMKYLKYGLYACTLILVIGLFAFNSYKTNNVKIENFGKNSFSINELDEVSSFKFDAISKNVDEKKLEKEFSFYEKLIKFDLLKNYNVEGLYIKDNNGKYNVLNNYVISSYIEDKSIMIAFSKDNEPLRDYFFDDKGDKYTTINGNVIKIYGYNNSYMTLFTYKGVNFDIETTNVNINEFKNILELVVK